MEWTLITKTETTMSSNLPSYLEYDEFLTAIYGEDIYIGELENEVTIAIFRNLTENEVKDIQDTIATDDDVKEMMM